MNHRPLSPLVLCGISSLLIVARAQTTFTYQDQDVILAIRQPAGQQNDLLFDLGPISRFNTPNTGYFSSTSPVDLSVTPNGTSIPDVINQVNFGLGSQDYTFSVFAGFNTALQSGSKTLWMSKPRPSLGDPSTPNGVSPWGRKDALTQGNTVSKIATIGNSSTAYGNSPGGYTGIPSTLNKRDFVSTPTSLSGGFTKIYGSGQNFSSTFQSTTVNPVDTTIPFGASDSHYANFYTLTPGSGAGTYNGFFALNGDGTLTFSSSNVVPVPEPHPGMLLLVAGVIGGFFFWRHR